MQTLPLLRTPTLASDTVHPILNVQALGIGLKLTFQGNNQLLQWETGYCAVVSAPWPPLPERQPVAHACAGRAASAGLTACTEARLKGRCISTWRRLATPAVRLQTRTGSTDSTECLKIACPSVKIPQSRRTPLRKWWR